MFFITFFGILANLGWPGCRVKLENMKQWMTFLESAPKKCIELSCSSKKMEKGLLCDQDLV